MQLLVCSKVRSLPLPQGIFAPLSLRHVSVKRWKKITFLKVWKKCEIPFLEFNSVCLYRQEFTTATPLQLISKAVNQVQKPFKLTFSSADTSAILGSGGGARFLIKSKTSRNRMILKYIRKQRENSLKTVQKVTSP